MATIVTRTGKGSALTFTEADDNFTNLNNDGIANSNSISALQTDKLDKAGGTVTGNLIVNGNVTLGAKLAGSIGNNSQSGANVTLTGTTTEIIRLTNSGLVSVAGIDSPSSGQKVVLVNKTGVNISVANDSSSALSANRIFTGNGSDVTLLPNASLSIIYDGSSSKWNVVGGTGSGGGSAGINYIVNTDASSGTVGWTTYADAAGAQPVDGSGGSPQPGLWITSSTTPLRGSADFNLVKDNSDRQGNGVAYDFTIDNADLARVLTVSFDYEVVSGNYATGDLTVYLIQDPAGTPVVIQPAGFQVVAATAGTKMTQIATFQTDSSQKNYRLCFHVATISPSPYTLALDNIVLGPTQQKVYGAVVTDWISYPTTIGATTGSVTNATATARYRRVGDSMEGEATITFANLSAAFTSPNITLPYGLFGDTSKIPDNDADRGIGICSCLDSATLAYGPWYVGYDYVTNKITAKYTPIVNATSASTLEPVRGTGITNTVPFTFNTNDKIFISWKLPILGWSSNVEVSSSTDTRVVAAQVAGDPASASALNPIIFPTTTYDTHGSYNASTGRYTAPVPGFYRVSGFAISVTAGTSLACFVNGVSRVLVGNTDSNGEVSFTGTVQVNAGDIIDLRPGGTLDLQSGSTFCIERLSGPSQIAASETVACRYTSSAGNAVANNITTYVDFATKDYDTHGIVLGSGSGNVTVTNTGWRAIIPVPGKYLIITKTISASGGGWAAGEYWENHIRKNDVQIESNFSASQATHSTFMGTYVASVIGCLAGDRIEISCKQTSGASLNIVNNAEYNSIEIVRVGN